VPSSEDDDRPTAPVFVFDPERGAVFRRDVGLGDIRGNDVEVFSGLKEGERIVTAGVAFLYDGMLARPWVAGQ